MSATVIVRVVLLNGPATASPLKSNSSVTIVRTNGNACHRVGQPCADQTGAQIADRVPDLVAAIAQFIDIAQVKVEHDIGIGGRAALGPAVGKRWCIGVELQVTSGLVVKYEASKGRAFFDRLMMRAAWEHAHDVHARGELFFEFVANELVDVEWFSQVPNRDVGLVVDDQMHVTTGAGLKRPTSDLHLQSNITAKTQATLRAFHAQCRDIAFDQRPISRRYLYQRDVLLGS